MKTSWNKLATLTLLAFTVLGTHVANAASEADNKELHEKESTLGALPVKGFAVKNRWGLTSEKEFSEKGFNSFSLEQYAYLPVGTSQNVEELSNRQITISGITTYEVLAFIKGGCHSSTVDSYFSTLGSFLILLNADVSASFLKEVDNSSASGLLPNYQTNVYVLNKTNFQQQLTYTDGAEASGANWNKSLFYVSRDPARS